MASRDVETVDVTGALQLRQQWSNGTQPADPPAGYTATNGAGDVVEQRDLTAAETAQYADMDASALAAVNGTELRDRLTAVLASYDTYLALPAPDQVQHLAQTAQLTRSVNGLIRVVLGLLGTTDGT